MGLLARFQIGDLVVYREDRDNPTKYLVVDYEDGRPVIACRTSARAFEWDVDPRDLVLVRRGR